MFGVSCWSASSRPLLQWLPAEANVVGFMSYNRVGMIDGWALKAGGCVESENKNRCDKTLIETKSQIRVDLGELGNVYGALWFHVKKTR